VVFRHSLNEQFHRIRPIDRHIGVYPSLIRGGVLQCDDRIDDLILYVTRGLVPGDLLQRVDLPLCQQ
jgi:hypothetical protein